MANSEPNNTAPKTSGWRLSVLQLAVLAAVAVPVAYILGRFATTLLAGSPWLAVATALVTLATGALLGIPIGLVFGHFKTPPAAAPAPYHPNFVAQQDKILAQVKDELNQDLALFESRKGNLDVLTRIDYLSGFWTAVKASGQLFVMQDPKLLSAIATAYYWLEQANRLERLAYEAQYSASTSPDNQNASTHFVAEARLLDGPLGVSLKAAIDGINDQLITDNPGPLDINI